MTGPHMTDRDGLLRSLEELMSSRGQFNAECRECGMHWSTFDRHGRHDPECIVGKVLKALATPSPAAGEWRMSLPIEAEWRFTNDVWAILKGDHNDLRRQQAILRAFQEATIPTPTPAPSPELPAETSAALRDAAEQFLDDMAAPSPAESEGPDGRRAGHSRLVYNKATRTIDKAATPPTAAPDYDFEELANGARYAPGPEYIEVLRDALRQAAALQRELAFAEARAMAATLDLGRREYRPARQTHSPTAPDQS